MKQIADYSMWSVNEQAGHFKCVKSTWKEYEKLRYWNILFHLNHKTKHSALILAINLKKTKQNKTKKTWL